MKKKYEKPQFEFIDFQLEDSLMDEDINQGLTPSFSENEGVEEW